MESSHVLGSPAPQLVNYSQTFGKNALALSAPAEEEDDDEEDETYVGSYLIIKSVTTPHNIQ